MITIGIISCGDDHDYSLDCLPSNLQKDILAFYPFNNGSLADFSANSHNLINLSTATATEDRNGNAKCAYKFDNKLTAEEFLVTSDSDFLNDLNEFSVSLWYQPLDLNIQNSGIEGLISRGNEARCPNKMGEWSMTLYDCRRAVFGHNNSVWAEPITNFDDGCQGEADALANKWHHVVGIKNGDDYKIYFNGVLNETASGDANCGNFQSAQNIGDIFVGYNFTGKIDDIILYNRELLQSEVDDLFGLKPCCQ